MVFSFFLLDEAPQLMLTQGTMGMPQQPQAAYGYAPMPGAVPGAVPGAPMPGYGYSM